MSRDYERRGMARRELIAWRRRWQDRGIGAAAMLSLWGLLTALGIS